MDAVPLLLPRDTHSHLRDLCIPPMRGHHRQKHILSASRILLLLSSNIHTARDRSSIF